MTTATEIAMFQVGKTYSCRSICDFDCVWSFEIVARTASTIKTACGKSFRINKKLTNHFACEMLFPLGQYSMAPVLRAK